MHESRHEVPFPEPPVFAEHAIGVSDIERAAATLHGIATRTPVLSSVEINARTGAQVYFKCESFQRTGAFKFRGAYNALSRLDETRRRAGVVAYSSGNHALGVALAARMLGMPATVVMPLDAPHTKIQAAVRWGARIVHYDRLREDREAITEELARTTGATIIASSDHPDVIAGQGTVAWELIEEVGPLDVLLVPVGGGGLLAGSAVAAAHASPGCAVIGVEPESGNDAQQSMHAGRIVHISSPPTIADGARNQHIGRLVLPIMQSLVREIVTVSDDRLREQMRFFIEQMRLVAEPTGCLAAAALTAGTLDLSGARVGVIVTGGNVANHVLSDALRPMQESVAA
jgi:threonine dehydratase